MSVTILGIDFLEITPDPVASNATEVIPKANVVGVIPQPYVERQPGDDTWNYPFNSVTVLVFHLSDRRKLAIELQTVSNQPGWNDGTLSGLVNAHDDVHLWLGGGSLSPSPSVLSSKSTLTFPDTIIGAFSPAQTTSISGNNLTNDIVITAPAGWIINQDGSNNDDGPITLVQVAGNVAPTTIYIKLNPSVYQSYNGTLTVSSVGASTQNVSLIGSAKQPVVTSDDADMPFPATEVDLYSDTQSFVVGGSGLYDPLVITSVPGFIINQDGSTNDDGPISLIPVSGVVPPTTIYVRFVPTVVGVYSGNIVVSSTSASSVNVAVDGLALFPQNRVYSYYHRT